MDAKTKEYGNQKIDTFKHLSRIYNISAGIYTSFGAFLSWTAGSDMVSGIISNNAQAQTASMIMGVVGALFILYGVHDSHRGALLAEKADELAVEQFAARKRP